MALEREVLAKAKRQVQKELDELRKAPIKDKVNRKNLSPDGDTAHEYLTVEDKVKYYVQPGHKWYPQVTKVEKISNPKLEEKWLQARCQVHDVTQTELKFHGTSKEAVDKIIEGGFKMPSKAGMFGKGIYFATDSSKSAQDLYTKGSNMLLLCEIAFGKVKTVDAAAPSMNSHTLSLQGYDSLFAKRDTKKKGGVLYDEYVVFNPDQAIPRYIVHYKQESVMSNQSSILEKVALSGTGGMVKYELKPNRSYKQDDPKDREFRVAESQFLRLMSHNGQNFKIQSVDFYVNPPLVAKFEVMSKKMTMKYGTNDEANPILAFHGTKQGNIDGIVKTNFDISKLASNTGDKGWYGAGIYFSEFPDVSLGYGQSLLLCRVLPGKSYNVGNKRMDGASLEPGYDSHIVNADSQGRGKELVIFNQNQILPCYVINFK